MTATSLFYWNDKHGKSQTRTLKLAFQITAAKTVSKLPAGLDVFSFFDAITQNQIDTYLGNTNDFLAAIFDSTSMGADAFGCIVNMEGQCAQVVSMSAICASGTGLATIVNRYARGSAGLTASTLETAVGVSTAGNIGIKVDFGNTPDFDALTAGLILVTVEWIAK